MTKEEFLGIHLCKTCVLSDCGVIWHYCKDGFDNLRNISCTYVQSNSLCYTSEELRTNHMIIGCDCHIIKKCYRYICKEKK